jgi:hypothetical protein
MSKLNSSELIKIYNQEHQFCECEECEPKNIWDKSEEDYEIETTTLFNQIK